MSIKSILVPLNGTDADSGPLETACLLANRFTGHLEGLFVYDTPIPQLSANYEGFSPAVREEWLAQTRHESEARDDAARAAFVEIVERKGLEYLEQPRVPERSTAPSRLSPASGQPTAAWQTQHGNVADIVSRWSGGFDLTVVGRGDPRANRSHEVAEGALFGTGGVVLLAPSETPATLGESIVIGWNNTAQSARAVASAIPFLAQTSHITIVTITTGAKQGPSCHDIAQRLAWHGLDASVVELAPDRRSVAQALMDEAHGRRADLLVMGAYSHSRMRELILGGVTKHVLQHADLPVLMAH